MQTENAAFRVKKITFPSSGERFVIIEGPPHGIALDAPSIYTSMRLREEGLSPNSMAQHLGAVVLLLKWAAAQSPPVDLDQRLHSVQLLSRDEILSLRRENVTRTARGEAPFLTKPFSSEGLVEAVSALLATR